MSTGLTLWVVSFVIAGAVETILFGGGTSELLSAQSTCFIRYRWKSLSKTCI